MGLPLSTRRPAWLSLRNRKVNSDSRWCQQFSPSFGIWLGSCHPIPSLLIGHPLESISWLSTQFWSCPGPVLPHIPTLLVLNTPGLGLQGTPLPRYCYQATAFFLPVGPLISKAVSSSISESQFPHLYNADCTSGEIYVLTCSFSIHGLSYGSPSMVFFFPSWTPFISLFGSSSLTICSKSCLISRSCWCSAAVVTWNGAPWSCAVYSLRRCTSVPCMDLLVWTRYPVL